MTEKKVDAGYKIEAAKLDKGLIRDLKERDIISDALLYTIPEDEGEQITCLIELKGTGRDEKVSYATDQIRRTISYLQNKEKYPDLAKYLENRGFVMAAIAGAPNKTLPRSSDDKTKTLCRELYRLSIRKKKIRNMDGLLVYVTPNRNYNRYSITGERSPYTFCCHNARDCHVPMPSALVELLNKNMK